MKSSQFVRYAVSGAGLALVFSIVYEIVLHIPDTNPQVANGIGFMVSTALGYIIHSRWSFSGDRQSYKSSSTVKFLIVNFSAFALNGFWVWLLVQKFGLSHHLPLLPILGVTPLISFWLNREWVFRKI